MASRADLTAHRRKRNPQRCVALPLSMGEVRHPFSQRHQGRKSARAGEISVKLHTIALLFNGKHPFC